LPHQHIKKLPHRGAFFFSFGRVRNAFEERPRHPFPAAQMPGRRSAATARMQACEHFFVFFRLFFQKGLAIEQMFCYTKSTEKQEKSAP
jgi:hypothetical protein